MMVPPEHSFLEKELLVAKQLLSQGKKEEAILTLKELAFMYPRNPKPWYWLGIVYQTYSQFKKARACFRESAKWQPYNPDLMIKIEECNAKKKMTFDAAKGKGAHVKTEKENFVRLNTLKELASTILELLKAKKSGKASNIISEMRLKCRLLFLIPDPKLYSQQLQDILKIVRKCTEIAPKILEISVIESYLQYFLGDYFRSMINADHARRYGYESKDAEAYLLSGMSELLAQMDPEHARFFTDTQMVREKLNKAVELQPNDKFITELAKAFLLQGEILDIQRFRAASDYFSKLNNLSVAISKAETEEEKTKARKALRDFLGY